MAKVIDYSDTWFQEVSPRSYYDEDDLETAVMQNLEIIFPEFTAVLFKKKLTDSVRGVKRIPDLAMIKKDYSEWYIIEVELGKHLKSHVLDQVEAFYNSAYDNTHATYIHSKRPSIFSLSKLKTMISSKTPEFMVIVNEPREDWVKDLAALRCKTCVFQIYHDFNGNPLYRINGEHPYIYTKFSHCKYQKGLPYAVEVLDKHFLDGYGIANGSKFTIEFNGRNFLWERKDAGGVFLICNSPRPPLDPLSSRYRLNFFQQINKSGTKKKTINAYSFTKD